MSDLRDARCAGKAELFESTLVADHLEAKTICCGDLERGGTNPPCPARRACLELLRIEAKPTATYHSAPSGTWAGMLVGSKKSERLA